MSAIIRQITHTMRQHGQIRLYNFGRYVDRELWGQTVEISIYDDMLRLERAEHLLVIYPRCYDTRPRRSTVIDDAQCHRYHSAQVIQLV